jgi:hypothetical protein
MRRLSGTYLGRSLLLTGRYGISNGESIDADAQSLFDSMDVQPPAEVRQMYIDLIEYFKDELSLTGTTSMWDEAKFIYLWDVHTRQAAYLNIKSPSANTLTQVSEQLGFHEYVGLVGNGASGLNLNFIPSDDFLQNDCSIYAFCDTNSTGTMAAFGVFNGSNTGIILRPRLVSNIIQSALNGALANVAGTVNDSSGMTGLRRSGAANYQNIKDDSVHATTTNTSATPSALSLYGMCLNNQGTPQNYETRTYYALVGGTSNLDREKLMTIFT